MISDKEKAFNVIKRKRVNVDLLVRCFRLKDDPSLPAEEPRGLYVYNNTYEPGDSWRPQLTYREYALLRKTLA